MSTFILKAIPTITVDAWYRKSLSVDPKSGTLCLQDDIHTKPKRLAGACKMLTVGLGAMAGFANRFLSTTGTSTTAQTNAV